MKSLEQSGQIPYTVLTTAGSYLDWVLMTAPEDSELFDVKEIAVEALVGETVARKLQKHISREALLSLPLDQVYDEELAAELEHHLTYEYEHLADVGLHTKATVSELKRAGQPVEEFSEEEQPVDLFAQWKSTGAAGAARKTGHGAGCQAWYSIPPGTGAAGFHNGSLS